MGYSWVFLGSAEFESEESLLSWLASEPRPEVFDDWPQGWGLAETAAPESVRSLLRVVGSGPACTVTTDTRSVLLRSIIEKDSDAWLTYRANIAAAWGSLPDFLGTGRLDVLGASDGPDAGFFVVADGERCIAGALDEAQIQGLRESDEYVRLHQVDPIDPIEDEEASNTAVEASEVAVALVARYARRAPLDEASTKELSDKLTEDCSPAFRDQTVRLVRRFVDRGMWDDLAAWVARPMWSLMGPAHLQGMRARPGIRKLLLETAPDDKDLGYQSLAIRLEVEPSELYRACEPYLDEVESVVRWGVLAQLANIPDAARAEPKWAQWCRRLVMTPGAEPGSALGSQVERAQQVLASLDDPPV